MPDRDLRLTSCFTDSQKKEEFAEKSKTFEIERIASSASWNFSIYWNILDGFIRNRVSSEAIFPFDV